MIGLSFATVVYALVKNLGGPIGEYLDQRSEEILDNLNVERNAKVKTLEASIEANQKLQENLQCRKDIFEVLQVCLL